MDNMNFNYLDRNFYVKFYLNVEKEDALDTLKANLEKFIDNKDIKKEE